MIVTSEFENLQRQYIQERPDYEDLTKLVIKALEDIALEHGLLCSVDGRAKEVHSFMTKAFTKKYKDPLREIRDKAGVRIVAHFPGDLQSLEGLVRSTFTILDVEDKRSITPPDRFDYRATHFQVLYPMAPGRLKGLECEVQVLTRAENLWATTAHDLFYKPPAPLPDHIKRTFHRLMSLVELFDLEVKRAKEEMSAIGEVPGEKLLHILLPHRHRLLTGKEYNAELSALVLTFFEDQVISELDDVASDLEKFVLDNREKIEGLFRRYSADPYANSLIGQPEIFIILLYLEKSIFILQEKWPDVLPIELLVSLADEWGVAIDP